MARLLLATIFSRCFSIIAIIWGEISHYMFDTYEIMENALSSVIISGMAVLLLMVYVAYIHVSLLLLYYYLDSNIIFFTDIHSKLHQQSIRRMLWILFEIPFSQAKSLYLDNSNQSCRNHRSRPDWGNERLALSKCCRRLAWSIASPIVHYIIINFGLRVP